VQKATPFYAAYGSDRQNATAGGLVITFSCPITSTSLHVVHLFARPMADWMKMWKSVSSRQLAAALDIAPPIWQPEYFDRCLRSQENYEQKWNYVEQNASRAGLIKEGEEWQYRGSIFDLMW